MLVKNAWDTYLFGETLNILNFLTINNMIIFSVLLESTYDEIIFSLIKICFIDLVTNIKYYMISSNIVF